MKYKDLDPRTIKTRFPSTCKKCGNTLPKGMNAYYFPASKAVFCLPCGEEDYRFFLSSVADEEAYQCQYN